MSKRSWIVAAGCCAAGWACAGAPVSVLSLLEEMTDRDRLARFPEPAYTSRLFGSYDRGSTAPDRPGWFANDDRSQFLRVEEGRGRREFVLLDAEGPGAVVRFWVTVARTDGSGVLRVYIDGRDTPEVEGPVLGVVSGGLLCGGPLSASVSEATAYLQRGHNLYLPIPYASRCVVTYQSETLTLPDRNAGESFYYNVECRTYGREVAVESFSRAGLARDAVGISELRRRLAGGERGASGPGAETAAFGGTLQPGETLTRVVEGSRAVRLLALSLNGGRDPQALRSTALELTFDGERTVWAPAGDFFGNAYALAPYRTWFTEVTGEGRMEASWVMPFARRCELKLHNLGTAPVTVAHGALVTAPWQWDARSMHFGAGWYEQSGLRTRTPANEKFDVNYVTLRGEGVLVGSGVALFNAANAWWGEGDEKVFVDDAPFPTHLGTGSEDYYGYAWSNPNPFDHPFIAQPEGRGANRAAPVVNLRYRSLDAIPFRKRLQLDLEMWHWADTVINHAPVAYWYMKPGGTSNRGPEPAQAARPLAQSRRDLIPLSPFAAGRLEGETLDGEADRGTVAPQSVASHGWSNGAQLWWTNGKPGDAARLRFAMAEGGRYAIKAALTHAPDYGVAEISLNGKVLVAGYDAYAPKVETRVADLGVAELAKGDNTLTLRLTGAHPLAQKDKHFLGLDYLDIVKAAD